MTAANEPRRQPIVPWLLALIRGGVAEGAGSPRRRIHLFVRAGMSLVGAGVVIAGVWLGVNVYPQAVPEPRWTEADLPSLPAASDNGWHAVTSEALDVQIPDPLAALLETRALDPEIFWTQVERETDSLVEFLASSGAREGNARIEQARRHTAFADACAIAKPCQLFDWHKAHDIALLQALTLAHAGRMTEALTLTRELLHMNAAQLASARLPMSLIIALDQLGDALDKADMIVARVDRSGADADLRAALAKLDDEVSAIEVDALDLRAVVVSEYLAYLEALNASRDAWFYSHGATREHVDAMFERRHEAAAEGDVFVAFGGEERSPTQSVGWWLYNPGGKLMLDVLAFDPTSLAGSIEEAREDIRAARARLLARG